MEWTDANQWQFSLLGQMNGIAWVLDPEGRTLYVNSRVPGVLGYEEEELVGHDWFDVAVPEDLRERLRGRYREIARLGGGKAQPFDSELLTASGARRSVRVFHAALRDEEGQVRAVAIGGEDTTEQLQTQAARQAADEFYRVLAEASQDMVFIIDPADRVVYVNSNAANHLGKPAEEIVGSPRSQLFPEANAQRQFRAIRRVLETGEALRSETQDAIGGQTIWLDTHLVPLRDGAGSVTSVMGVARDITSRRLAEDVEKLAALGQLAAGIGHEFNNILAGLALAAEIAADEDPGSTCRELARYVARATAQGAHICNQLAAFARPSPPEREACTIEETLEAALAVVRNQLGQTGVIVARAYASGGRSVEVDRSQMQQVFVNLFINALHAMPGGGTLALQTAYAPAGDGRGEISVTVSDTGTGIEPGHLARVFEPFYTTKGALGDSGQPGTGLGLSVSHSIVSSHGGQIAVYSDPGAGATFVVSLPALDVAPAREGRAHPSAAAWPPRGARALVADDGSDLLRQVTAALSGAGYEVVAANGTQEALAALREEHLDVVLTDLLMPGGGGHAVLEQARLCAPAPPVVVMSGRLSADAESEALRAGAHSFLQKPFSRDALLSAIADVLRTSGGASGACPHNPHKVT